MAAAQRPKMHFSKFEFKKGGKISNSSMVTPRGLEFEYVHQGVRGNDCANLQTRRPFTKVRGQQSVLNLRGFFTPFSWKNSPRL